MSNASVVLAVNMQASSAGRSLQNLKLDVLLTRRPARPTAKNWTPPLVILSRQPKNCLANHSWPSYADLEGAPDVETRQSLQKTLNHKHGITCKICCTLPFMKILLRCWSTCRGTYLHLFGVILPGIVVSVCVWYKVIVTSVFSPTVKSVVYMKDCIVLPNCCLLRRYVTGGLTRRCEADVRLEIRLIPITLGIMNLLLWY